MCELRVCRMTSFPLFMLDSAPDRNTAAPANVLFSLPRNEMSEVDSTLTPPDMPRRAERLELGLLDLLSTPALVSLAHVGRGLDRRNELESDVADTNEADNAAGNDAEDMVVEEDRADEDVEDTPTEE